VIRLYDKPECPFCYRVRTALGFAGVDFERRPHDDPEAQREWRALTEAKTVPVMVDGDLVLTDSAVMLEYVHDRCGRLLPEDPVERARLRSLVQYADRPLGQGSKEVVFAKRGVPEADWDHERIAAGAERFVAALPLLDERLADHEYLVDDYSVADIATWPWISRFEWQTIDLNDYPNVKRWYLAIAGRPAVQRGYHVPKKLQEIPMP